ncbi:hemin uptake protein HemP [Vogesella sp. XCS3]|uniref:hemin uptake protein HemP n=1 Tax=Vogesella sp. XCS3 TaxID=2877939 RepID=UPI001D0A5EAB|nr:hemin uptake protein HemP [Vogesella sp. XCS3]UDM17417.1 hemin uptake protein HemP [Vogesella sp. XCS3]
MNNTPTQTTVPGTPNAPALPAELLDIISSDSLFAQRKALLIEHNGQQYRLQITKQNKLILTK